METSVLQFCLRVSALSSHMLQHSEPHTLLADNVVRIYSHLPITTLRGQRHDQESGPHGTVTAFQEHVHGTHGGL